MASPSKLRALIPHPLLAFILLACATISNAQTLSTPKALGGAVASESKICSEIGIGLLKRGGNAADALVGTTLCVGVTSMQHSGIGGGGFMLVRGSDGSYESIDFRETAPAAAFEDMYKENPKFSIYGGLASGVPGDIKGLEYLHEKYGSLPWEVVVNPAAHIAINGFQVTDDIARYMELAVRWSQRNFFVEDPSWAVDFAPNGKLVLAGDILTRKRYGETLKTIGKHGAKAFYEGDIANYTINAIQAANGTMTLSDLKSYSVEIREPVNITYNGYRLYSTGVPSGGAVALSILKIMEGYSSNDKNLSIHRLDEAMRYSYAARSKLGDPAFFKHMSTFEASMISPPTASKIRSLILDDRTRNVSEYAQLQNKELFAMPENHGTSHIVASDSSGLSISLTSTVNLLFGSLLVVPETGIVLNNEMNDFSIPNVTNEFNLPPSPINYIRPLKRPLSSITPIIVEHPNGTLYLTIGAAGGSRIITATAQCVWHVLEGNLTVPEALGKARLHDQLIPGRTTFEDSLGGKIEGFDEAVVRSMREKGHNVTWISLPEAAVQGIRVLGDGSFEAGSEPRQKNSAGLSV